MNNHTLNKFLNTGTVQCQTEDEVYSLMKFLRLNGFDQLSKVDFSLTKLTVYLTNDFE
jgi:hypothetical protein